MKKILIMISILLVALILVGCKKPEQKIITLNLNSGLDTIELGEAWVDGKATLKINDEEELLIGEHNININKIGTYEVIYAKVVNEKEYKISRNVVVVDVNGPVITLLEGLDTVIVGHHWTDAGVKVTDDSGEIIVPTMMGEVNTYAEGEYIITYKAIDSTGNETVISRYVNVVKG